MIVLYFIKQRYNIFFAIILIFFAKFEEQDKCKFQQHPFFFCFSFFFFVILVVGTSTGMKLYLYEKIHFLLFVLDWSQSDNLKCSGNSFTIFGTCL